MESATIVLTNAKAGDVLTLGALPGGIIGDVVSGPGTITVTLTGSASKAAYQTAINGVTFHNTSDTPDTTPRTINVTVNDGALGSNVATSTLTVTATNDLPLFTGLNGTPGHTEGGAAVVLDGNALLSDIELDAANNYDGATLTLARNGGASVQDVFGTTGTLSFSGANVLVGATVIGTVTQSGGTLAITFNANATSALVDSALRN